MSMVGNPLIFSNNPVYTDVGDGTTATFVLPWTPPTINSILVDVGGVTQTGGVDYTQSGTNVVFVTAPATGLNITIRALTLAGTAAVPSGGSVIDSSFASPVTGTGSIVRGTSPTIATPTTTGLIDNQGGQIKFPATQVPSADANTLDDYEEGTYTPTYSLAGGSGIAISGKYTKIGNQVTVTIVITGTSITATGGTSSVTLPITCPTYCVGMAVGNSGTTGGVGVGGNGSVNLFLPTITASSAVAVYVTYFV